MEPMIGDRTWAEWEAAADTGTVHDEDNPIFVLQSAGRDVLEQIAMGKIDMAAVALRELRNRGVTVMLPPWIANNPPLTLNTVAGPTE